jgi:hypothetical protein
MQALNASAHPRQHACVHVHRGEWVRHVTLYTCVCVCVCVCVCDTHDAVCVCVCVHVCTTCVCVCTRARARCDMLLITATSYQDDDDDDKARKYLSTLGLTDVDRVNRPLLVAREHQKVCKAFASTGQFTKLPETIAAIGCTVNEFQANEFIKALVSACGVIANLFNPAMDSNRFACWQR